MAKTKKTADSGSNGERKPRRATTPRRRKSAGESAPHSPAAFNTAAPDDSSVSMLDAIAGQAGAPSGVASPGETRPASPGGTGTVVVSPGATLFEAQPAAAPAPRRPAVTAEDIAKRAYEIFCERGRTHGHHLDDWLRAERELLQRGS